MTRPLWVARWKDASLWWMEPRHFGRRINTELAAIQPLALKAAAAWRWLLLRFPICCYHAECSIAGKFYLLASGGHPLNALICMCAHFHSTYYMHSRSIERRHLRCRHVKHWQTRPGRMASQQLGTLCSSDVCHGNVSNMAKTCKECCWLTYYYSNTSWDFPSSKGRMPGKATVLIRVT